MNAKRSSMKVLTNLEREGGKKGGKEGQTERSTMPESAKQERDNDGGQGEWKEGGGGGKAGDTYRKQRNRHGKWLTLLSR